MVLNLPNLNFHRKSKMKIVDFKRDEFNNIFAIGKDGTEVQLDFSYIEKHKPQIGDECEAEASEKPVPAATAA